MPKFQNTYIVKSKKVVDFFNQNKRFDFDVMNEFLVDLLNSLGKFYNGNNITGNELKQMLLLINEKVDHLDSKQGEMRENLSHLSDIQKLTNDNLNSHKEFYVSNVKSAIEESRSNNGFLSLMKETTESMVEKTIQQLKVDFPKINEGIVDQLRTIVLDGVGKGEIESVLREKQDDLQTFLHKFIYQNHASMMDKMNDMHQITLEFQQFLEKQKNSTLKGKESEEKLEASLNCLFPYGEIINQSKEPKSCDYLVKRENKPDILFENKDYRTNVPNEEIKKFIRDIEFQHKHGIFLSQTSGINNKRNYQIDIHMGYILVYVHHVQNDETKIMNAVQLIDHLDPILRKHTTDNGVSIPLDVLSEINKEYLSFIGQKKQLIENFKKYTKDHLKQLEEFELSKLTLMLNNTFTNVDQLCYKCDICNKYTAKNKRALTTHKNKCRKIHGQLVVVNSASSDAVNLNEHD